MGALPGAQVFANPAGPYCVADEAGECTLSFFESAPQDRIELYATSSSGREGPILAGTLGQLVKRGAALQTARSYPTLNVSITDCKTHQPLTGWGNVLASPTRDRRLHR
ncbi:MAG TPA: hypothetical protein VNN80_13540 [Polyangiaceae bacterium]|nr:hypothetical protein [Polyangiaceae bacterium]